MSVVNHADRGELHFCFSGQPQHEPALRKVKIPPPTPAALSELADFAFGFEHIKLESPWCIRENGF